MSSLRVGEQACELGPLTGVLGAPVREGELEDCRHLLLGLPQAEEFEHAIWHVASAADAYEKEKGGGKDEF